MRNCVPVQRAEKCRNPSVVMNRLGSARAAIRNRDKSGRDIDENARRRRARILGPAEYSERASRSLPRGRAALLLMRETFPTGRGSRLVTDMCDPRRNSRAAPGLIIRARALLAE